MNRVTWKHAVAGLALLATLSLAVPAPAHAAARGFGAAAGWSAGWGWLSSLWDQLAMWAGFGGKDASRRAVAKSGDSLAAAGTGSSSADDNGSMINPDGHP
jgi:hypothetical protein